MPPRLIYIVGASGSGKDSLISHSRKILEDDPHVQFAHRYITRPADTGGENHIALTYREFCSRKNAGLFALHWSSHGYEYGIGIEINQWLEKNITVVVNGSRSYLKQAVLTYPELIPVCVDVSSEVLRQRLRTRGRESDSDIEARLRRHQELRPHFQDGLMIDNDRQLDESSAALCRMIDSCRRQ